MRKLYLLEILQCIAIATIFFCFHSINWGSHFYYFIGLSIFSIIFGILGYFFKNHILRYASYIYSLIVTTYFIHDVFRHTECFNSIKLLFLTIAIILSNQIMVLLEKILKDNRLSLIEKIYVKCEFEKASALTIIAASYNALTLLTQAAQIWENKNLAAWFVGKDIFYSWLSIIYIALGLIFIFMGLEIVGAITLVAAGHTTISFIHHNALSWQNASLAAWFVSQHAFNIWIFIFYSASALTCIFVSSRKKLLPLKLIGFYLIFLALWKLWFIIIEIFK